MRKRNRYQVESGVYDHGDVVREGGIPKNKLCPEPGFANMRNLKL